MFLRTQLQGLIPPRFPMRRPRPRQEVQACKANANVSDLVHSILLFLSPKYPVPGRPQIPGPEYYSALIRQPYIFWGFLI